MRRIYPAISTIILAVCLSLNVAAQSPEKLVGLFAPDFNLSGSIGGSHRLSTMIKNGPVVATWFPKAYTGNCETMLKSLAAVKQQLSAKNVTLVAASGDKLKYLKPYAESLGLDYPILADPTRTHAAAWTVVGDGRELPRRWIFLIGTDGKIASVLSDFSAAEAGKAVLDEAGKLGWMK
jgi:peroxiredoxin Q/BCP